MINPDFKSHFVSESELIAAAKELYLLDDDYTETEYSALCTEQLIGKFADAEDLGYYIADGGAFRDVTNYKDYGKGLIAKGEIIMATNGVAFWAN